MKLFIRHRWVAPTAESARMWVIAWVAPTAESARMWVIAWVAPTAESARMWVIADLRRRVIDEEFEHNEK